MEAMPSEYQNMGLSKSEKLFIRYILCHDEYGLLLIKINPAMLSGDCMHALICSEGIILFKFMENFEDAATFPVIMDAYINSVYIQTVKIIGSRLAANKAIVDSLGRLMFPVSMLYVFPKLEFESVYNVCDGGLKDFIHNHCMFKNELSGLRNEFIKIKEKYLRVSIVDTSDEILTIGDKNVNTILQRIAPEYTTIRVATVVDKQTKAGADDELLVVTENDIAVKAFRLDTDQINIVNKIVRGDQLILACAGSGKSVLLIAKCFKAAVMNPDKQFVITCYSSKLCSLYTWFIDRAGLKAKNVTCLTFHNFCKRLLNKNGISTPSKKFDQWVAQAQYHLNNGKITQRYYGIFIDEVQEFTTEWYKFCFNLLENKNSDDHLFVICGDKTQKIMKEQKHGRAPWNAGEGYPNYRGGNKSIRIEKNYRNCIEINEYINRYVSYAKAYLAMIEKNTELDPDMFLRGKAIYHGIGVKIKSLVNRSNNGEAAEVIKSIDYIHDELGIPYDEISVVMNNGHYSKQFNGWKDRKYDIETSLTKLID
ncbi:MAG: AAA family ATPase, partial [Lachnospiraceae bacterium]|nr:AAA family ATPase [Lachnospiraceae bacterium]